MQASHLIKAGNWMQKVTVCMVSGNLINLKCMKTSSSNLDPTLLPDLGLVGRPCFNKV